MKFNLTKIVQEKDIRLVIFDIDGTVKDLYMEHKMALVKTLKDFNIYDTKRAKLALGLNSIGMKFFEWGCLPTNCIMQKILIYIMSVITVCRYKKFKKLYYDNYPKEPILFSEMKKQILALSDKVKLVFASTNLHTFNIKQEICKTFCVEEPRKKIYKDIITEENVPANSVVIIGDNFFDDYIPAKSLGCHVHIVNMYNSGLKENILKRFQS